MENIPKNIPKTHIWDLDLKTFDPYTVSKVLKLVEKTDFKELLPLLTAETRKGFLLKKFSNVIKKLSEYGIKEMVNNRDGITFPHGLGNLCIVMFKKSNYKKYNDFELSKKYNQDILRKSPETDELYPKTYHNSLSGNTKKYKFKEYWLFKQSHFLRDIINKETKKNPYVYLRVGDLKVFSQNMKFITKLKKEC